MIKLVPYRANEYDLYEVKVNTFSAGETKFELPDDKRAHYRGIYWYYENDSEMFVIMCLVNEMPALKKYLYMPYFPHARMDRTKSVKDVFTLKWFCKWLNSLKFDFIEVLDPHSDVCVALLDNVHIHPIDDKINKAIRIICSENTKQDESITDYTNNGFALFYPDQGAYKRYNHGVVNNTCYHSTYGNKDREWGTNQIKSLTIANPAEVKDKDVLIVDDICSYGGTFYRAATALKEAEARKVYLYITHCENAIWLGKLPNSGLIEKVFTTDSIRRSYVDESDWLIEV